MAAYALCDGRHFAACTGSQMNTTAGLPALPIAKSHVGGWELCQVGRVDFIQSPCPHQGSDSHLPQQSTTSPSNSTRRTQNKTHSSSSGGLRRGPKPGAVTALFGPAAALAGDALLVSRPPGLLCEIGGSPAGPERDLLVCRLVAAQHSKVCDKGERSNSQWGGCWHVGLYDIPRKEGE
jgi:hypothetical protein